MLSKVFFTRWSTTSFEWLFKCRQIWTSSTRQTCRNQGRRFSIVLDQIKMMQAVYSYYTLYTVLNNKQKTQVTTTLRWSGSMLMSTKMKTNTTKTILILVNSMRMKIIYSKVFESSKVECHLIPLIIWLGDEKKLRSLLGASIGWFELIKGVECLPRAGLGVARDDINVTEKEIDWLT